MNNNGSRTNHYKLGDKISNIENRLGKIEEALKIIRSTFSDSDWDFHKWSIEKNEEFKRAMKNLAEEMKRFEWMGTYEDVC